jgi:hypothetical protein
LKQEIRRVLELEAENEVLQEESLATLPQLQEDQAGFLKLQERYFQVPIAGFSL